MTSDQQAKMTEALDALRGILPDQPLLLIAGFADGPSTAICTASNLTSSGQLIILLDVASTFAQAAFNPPDEFETQH